MDVLLPRDAMGDLVHVLVLEASPVAYLLVEELVQVQANHLGFLADTQAETGNVLEDEKQNAGDDKAVGGDGSNLSELLADLDAITVDSTSCQSSTIERRDGLVSEAASEERSDHAADAMELEHVQSFVDTKPLVQILKRRTDDCSQEANDCREPERDVTGGRSDADKTSDGALASANHGELALGADVVDHDPANGASGSSNIGVEGGIHGADGAVESGATVEAEPTEPDQDGAKEDKRSVMRLAVRALAGVLALAEDESISKTSPTGRNVDRPATSKVKRGKVE